MHVQGEVCMHATLHCAMVEVLPKPCRLAGRAQKLRGLVGDTAMHAETVCTSLADEDRVEASIFTLSWTTSSKPYCLMNPRLISNDSRTQGISVTRVCAALLGLGTHLKDICCMHGIVVWHLQAWHGVEQVGEQAGKGKAIMSTVSNSPGEPFVV